MPAKNLSHLAQLIADDGHATTFQSLGQYRQALLKEITQASAAPEQEAVAPIKIEVRDGCVYLRSGPLDPGEYKLYPHADPSEVERLRAENIELSSSATSWRIHYDRACTERDDVRQKLAEAQALLREASQWMVGVSDHFGAMLQTPISNTIEQRINAFLSATAQPAEVKS